MSKIKLLILLLTSLFLFNCSSNNQLSNNIKLSVGYIGGGYDGLILSNTLISYLNNFNILDQNSNYELQSNISHSDNLFITNIDNTSDRERVISNIDIKIFNSEQNCFTYSLNESVSQFYILASSDKFISNKSALENIKIENTEYLVKKFINNLDENSFDCN
tara:strand:+ start:617 stop:1102 length:486 start_codon:yes stop_codon:yes gene_type:complete